MIPTEVWLNTTSHHELVDRLAQYRVESRGEYAAVVGMIDAITRHTDGSDGEKMTAIAVVLAALDEAQERESC